MTAATGESIATEPTEMPFSNALVCDHGASGCMSECMMLSTKTVRLEKPDGWWR